MKLVTVSGGWQWRCRNCAAKCFGAGPAGGSSLSIWLFVFEGWREARRHARTEGHDVEFSATETIFPKWAAPQPGPVSTYGGDRE